jgi:hypothetical protein
MRVQRKASAMVALAAAYAVVLQTTLLTIGGPLFGSPAFASHSLCSTLTGPSQVPVAPTGRATGCLAACLACCCGAANTPALPVTTAYRSIPPRLIGVKTTAAAVLPVGTARAHRSRAPPLY